MVDVTPKDPTYRRAVARGRVYMEPETTALVARGAITKGDVLAVARVAAIQAAKRAADLLPLCHSVMIGAIIVNFDIRDNFVEVEASVDTVDRTGVEMEALTACSVAAPYGSSPSINGTSAGQGTASNATPASRASTRSR